MKPTHPGWWWYREQKRDWTEWRAAKVDGNPEALFFYAIYNDSGFVDNPNIEWGPEIPQYKPQL